MVKNVLKVIHRQIEEAFEDLSRYPPHELNWPTRVKATAQVLIPFLHKEAPRLRAYVEAVLNAPVELRRLWSDLRGRVDLPPTLIANFDRQLSLDDILRESVTGEVVSKVVTKYLSDTKLDLKSNGRSDYPDLYLETLDYSGLAQFQRKRSDGDVEYGAALKGKEKRPVRVPDGLEIKTCRNQQIN